MKKTFDNYRFEDVQVRLSQCYFKGSIVFDYSAVRLHLHAFSGIMLDVEVPLASNSDVSSPQNEPPVRAEYLAWCDSHKGTDWAREIVLHIYGSRTKYVQTGN
jgi:hypothetical protein